MVHQEGNDTVTIMLGQSRPHNLQETATAKELMQSMFVRLMFSQMALEKLVEDLWTDFAETLASLSSDDITSICNVIRNPGG